MNKPTTKTYSILNMREIVWLLFSELAGIIRIAEENVSD